MPHTLAIDISWSYLSNVALPLIFKKFPFLITPESSGTCSFFANTFTVIVSVKSVTLNIIIVLSLRISRISTLRTIPEIITSPIAVSICSIGVTSPSKSLPYKTSSLAGFLLYVLSSSLPLLSLAKNAALAAFCFAAVSAFLAAFCSEVSFLSSLPSALSSAAAIILFSISLTRRLILYAFSLSYWLSFFLAY